MDLPGQTADDTAPASEIEQPVALPDRWPSEIPLLFFTVLTALGIWLLLVLSIFGLVYGVMIGLAMYLAHLAFVTHLRGSAIRLGENQLPELHERVRRLVARAGLKRMPEVYLLESGGALNALATKFLGSSIVVLYSSLLEACGDDEMARDTVIAHELSHLRAGHLRFRWLLAPAFITPFPGLVYSRACELTCDRWAAAITGDRDGALRGITVLAAGGRFMSKVNLAKFALQKKDLDTALMTIGTWLSTHPPLCRRLEALNPELTAGLPVSVRGPFRAVLVLLVLFFIPIIGLTILAGRFMERFDQLVEEAGSDYDLYDDDPYYSYEDSDYSDLSDADFENTGADLDELQRVVEEFRSRNGALPADADALSAVWSVLRPGIDEPIDPCDGESFGFTVVAGGGYRIWSCGPDEIGGTGDDLMRMSFPPSVDGRCREDLDSLAVFVRDFRRQNGSPPPDEVDLYNLWRSVAGGDPFPTDPFAPYADDWFGYEALDESCRLWSVGPDGISGSNDDISVDCGSLE